jgi:hypothetical protein
MTGAAMIPKVLGADVELGNFVVGGADEGSGAEASRDLLAAFVAVTGAVGRFDDEPSTANGGNAQDWSRFFLPSTGGGAYIDLRHLELTLGEQPSARAFVAAWQGMLLLAQQALHHANQKAGGRRYCALVNNSDGQGNSYGGHLNLLVTRRAWTDALERKPHLLAMLASYQVASMVVTGQGKVGTGEEGRPGRFELSQRAGFTQCLVGPQTTFRRPVVNSRFESHSTIDTARLHVICYDTGLTPVGTLLKAGGLQLVMAAVEAGEAPRDLALEDPVATLHAWSADPTLRTRAPLVDGRNVTVVELLAMFMERLGGFAARAEREGIVRDGARIASTWVSTLEQLARGDWPAVARRLDWALKLGAIERAMAQAPGLGWTSAAAKHLDHLYASLDPNEGLYWAMHRGGAVEAVVSPGEIERAAAEPPPDTRAWGRAMMLRRAPPWSIDEVDWDRVRFWAAGQEGRLTRWQVDLPSPLAATECAWRDAFQRETGFEELLVSLGGRPVAPPSRDGWGQGSQWRAGWSSTDEGGYRHG